MPPKRREVPSARGVRGGARSQSIIQATSGETLNVIATPNSPATCSSTNPQGTPMVVTRESVATDRLELRKGGTRGSAKLRSTRGRGRQGMVQDEIPDVYRDMLVDVEELSDSEERRPLKRQKVVGITSEVGLPAGDKGKGILFEDTEDDDQEQHLENQDNHKNEVVLTDESEEDEEDWEDVDLSKKPISFKEPSNPQTLELILDTKGKQKLGPARRIITAVDRRIRLEVHKMHLLCLLTHVYQRSRWCNISTVKENLRPLITNEVHSLLNPDPKDQQFRRSYNFLEGLNKASEMWQKRFCITRKGTSKPHWHDDKALNIMLSLPPKDGDPPMKKDDFLATSVSLAGSRDLGAQLFCALLRTAGDKSAPAKPAPTTPIATPQENSTSDDDNRIQVNHRFGGPSPVATPTPPARGRGSGLRRPRFREPVINPPITAKKTPSIIIKDSPYPVYWVEAWNMATQRWIAVDPLVTYTIGKPSKLEPPMSDIENTMSYVVAFEEEGQAIDVTRRYSKSYNGKTRKLRVSCTKGGLEWWDNVLKVFQRGWDLDRDQLEAAELLDREVSEPIPNNIQDLKDHPLFALKRHLKRGEVIHPERKVGSVTIGTGNKKVTEAIFRRQDVKIVKSSEQWYKMGRELKPGEQPLKYIAARRRLKGRSDCIDDEPEDKGEGGQQLAMYAIFQTVLYEPPAVVHGRVPKNNFGNLDVFIPSMVPKGGVHLPYKGIMKAARLLGVDYAEAVTGFDFKGRQASPIINGIVIAKEYREAVEAVMEAFLDEQNEADEFKKSIEALKRWRRFLIGLRIRERLGIYQDNKNIQENDGISVENRVEGKDSRGGFLMEEIKGDNSDAFVSDGSEGGGGFFIGDSGGEDGEGGFFVEEEKSEEGEEILEDPEDEDLGWF